MVNRTAITLVAIVLLLNNIIVRIKQGLQTAKYTMRDRILLTGIIIFGTLAIVITIYYV
jgi:hypothetical protein